jgi:cytochrome P450
VLELDPYAWEFHEDPYPTYRRLRDEAPLYRNERLGFWALSRHEDVLAGFKNTAHLSNADGVSLDRAVEGAAADRASFLAMDPPRHDELRGLVARGFTPKRVADLEPHIRDIATAHIDRFIERGACDFIREFAGPLPMDVVSELLGVPAEDRDRLRALAETLLHREDGVAGIPPAAADAARSITAYFRDLVVPRRRQPGSDLASALLAAELDGARLSERDVIAFLFLMIIAGNETTTKLLGNALYWLWRNPAARAAMRADPALVAGWVEETLRYDSSTQMLARTVRGGVTFHGRTLSDGDRVLLLVGAANRDERAFPDPDRFDVRRDASAHLAFGRGTHFCMGAALARLEARVALEEVQRRFADFEIEPGALVRVHSINVRGYAAMPIRFTPCTITQSIPRSA